MRINVDPYDKRRVRLTTPAGELIVVDVNPSLDTSVLDDPEVNELIGNIFGVFGSQGALSERDEVKDLIESAIIAASFG